MNTAAEPVVSPGQVVIDVIGISNAAADLNLQRSTVWRWSQPREAGGTDGIVPSRYHRPLLRLAQRLGKTLSTDDLVHGRGAH